MPSDTDREGDPASLPDTAQNQPGQVPWDPTILPERAVQIQHHGSALQQGPYSAYSANIHPVQTLHQSAQPYPPYSSSVRTMDPYAYSTPPYPRQVSDPHYARPPSRSNSASAGSPESVPYATPYVAPYQAVSSIPPPGQAVRTRWAWVQMEVPDTHPQDDVHSQYAPYPSSYYPAQASVTSPIYQQYADQPGTYPVHPGGQFDPYQYSRYPGHYPPPQPHVMMPSRPAWRPPSAAAAQSSGHSAAAASASNRRQPSATTTSGNAPRRSGTGTSSSSSGLSSPRRGGTILPPKPAVVHPDITEGSVQIASPSDLESSPASQDDNNNPVTVSQGDSAADASATVPGRGLRPHYHPQQGPRSDFVMWCGNVPQNATVEELWELFSRLPSASAGGQANPSEDCDSFDAAAADADHGVLSIFIISRSNCAFVNYASPAHLERAVAHFHGKAVRPQDPRCPKLVCRIRKKDDEAQAGVAGQRNRGIHVAWLKEQKLAGLEDVRASSGKGMVSSEVDTSPIAPESVGSEPISPSLTTASKDTQGGALSAATAGSYSSSGSASYASTNSSLLRHPAFRHRFFILKSLRREDLDRSIETGYWSTQPHNEAILDQAYRNSESVFLIFGVNQTGQFHGYARMAGLINTPTEPKTKEDQRKVTSILPSASVNAPPSTIMESPHESESEDKERFHPQLIKSDIDAAQSLFPGATFNDQSDDGQLPMTSPLPITPIEETIGTSGATDLSEGASTPRRSTTKIGSIAQSSSWPYSSIKSTTKATTVLGQDQRRTESPPATGAQAEFDSQGVRRLDTEATSQATLNPGDTISLGPTDSASWSSGDNRLAEQIALRAVIHNLRLDEIDSRGKAEHLENQLRSASSETSADVASSMPSEEAGGQCDSNDPPRHSSSDSWGKPFRVDWIRTDQLPFHRIKKLRNPWRDNRQIKVSRDGTEVEPGVGQQLLQEWNRDAPAATLNKPQPPVGSDEDE